MGVGHRTCTVFIYFIQFLYVLYNIHISLYIIYILYIYIYVRFIYPPHLYIFTSIYTLPYISIFYTPLYIHSSLHLYILYISYIAHTSLCITSAEGDLSLRDKHLSVVFSLRSKPNKQFSNIFHNYQP